MAPTIQKWRSRALVRQTTASIERTLEGELGGSSCSVKSWERPKRHPHVDANAQLGVPQAWEATRCTLEL
eukprot:6297784-Heterocapsa_arctica.AAC.1